MHRRGQRTSSKTRALEKANYTKLFSKLVISGNAFSVTCEIWPIFENEFSEKAVLCWGKAKYRRLMFSKVFPMLFSKLQLYIKIFLIFYFQSTGEIRTSYRRCSIKKCSWKFRKSYRKTSVPEYCNFIKKETPRQ